MQIKLLRRQCTLHTVLLHDGSYAMFSDFFVSVHAHAILVLCQEVQVRRLGMQLQPGSWIDAR